MQDSLKSADLSFFIIKWKNIENEQFAQRKNIVSLEGRVIVSINLFFYSLLDKNQARKLFFLIENMFLIEFQSVFLSFVKLLLNYESINRLLSF